MLKVTIEIVPGGVGTSCEIAVLKMGNVSQLADVSDYVWWIERNGRRTDEGDVIGHRRSDGWEPLVQNALSQITGIGQPEPLVATGTLDPLIHHETTNGCGGHV